MRVPMSTDAARRHPPTASETAIRTACEARAAAAALARAEDRETVRCGPVVSHHPPVGGFYPERDGKPVPGQTTGETLRDWSGIIAQGAAFLLLAALAFMG